MLSTISYGPGTCDPACMKVVPLGNVDLIAIPSFLVDIVVLAALTHLHTLFSIACSSMISEASSVVEVFSLAFGRGVNEPTNQRCQP